jgi:hypothetical protein
VASADDYYVEVFVEWHGQFRNPLMVREGLD